MTQQEFERLGRIIEGIDHANDAIAMFDPDGTFIYCNRAWKVLHRLDLDIDYTGQKDSVIDIPELRPGIEEIKADLVPGDLYVTRKMLEVDGTVRTFQISVDFISDGGAPVVLVMFRDISELENKRTDLKEYRDRLEETVKVRTAELEEANEMLAAQVMERREAEKSLRESEEYTRTLFKALPVPTYTFRKQAGTFVFQDYNDAALEMTKGHVVDDVGKKAGDFLRDRPRILEDLEKCFSEKKTFEKEIDFYDDVIAERWDLSVKYVFVPPDTVMVHTENVTARVSAERELKKHRDHLQELVRERTAELEEANKLLREEIAQREKAQGALVESEQKYRTISEMTSDYTFVATFLPDGTLRREWMAGAFEKITGYTREELKEMLNEFSVVHPADRPKVMQVLPEMQAQQPIESVEFRMVTKSGDDVWVEAVAKPLPSSREGYPRGMIAVKDINDRKTAEVKLARRNRELAAVNRIRDIFDTETEDPKILEGVLDAMLVNSEALLACVCMFDKESREIVLSATRNVPADLAEKYMHTPVDETAAARIIEGGKVMMLEDVGGHPRDRADAIRRLGVLQTVVFPVSVRDKAIAIYMMGYGKERDLEPRKIRYFEIIRSQLAMQFERRELLANRKWHEKELKELTGSLIGLLEKERTMMALKLHDELGQELVAINGEILFLENELESCENKPKETLAKIKEQLKELTRNVRKMSYSIHPAVLEDLGLRPALRSYIGGFIESDDLRVELVTTGFDGKLTGEEALAMYRVAQEALTNVLRHAEARNVTVRIIRGYPDLIMTIEDDGRGFNPGGEESRGKGLGIIKMRERLERMGGRFKMYSAPGRGTRIRASIPMEGQDDE
jgi:PAS domain S-box-containing protein